MLVLLLFVSAMQHAPTAAHVQEMERAAPAIRREFDSRLLDYPSARFRDVRVTINASVEGERGAYLCGFVNAKNRMGAYTGWQQFMVSGTDLLLEGETLADILLPSTCGTSALQDPVDRSDLLSPR